MWYKSSGNDNDVVISTRLRLARNFKGISFPGKMNDDEANTVISRIKDAIVNSGTAISNSFRYIDINKSEDIEKAYLLEEHMISNEMIKGLCPRGVLIGYDDKVSIMINEEDHLRMQCILGGYDLLGAYDIINKIDNIIEEQIDYAFSEKYGYLTKCPTNTGTGMRASVMLHLPGLSITGNINNIVEAVNKLGITVRGLYGEGSQAKAYIYQVSNQVTLGINEEETLSKLKDVVDMIIEKEREVCKTLYETNTLSFKDKISRAFGVMSGAYIMSSEEFMNMIPYARMGINMNLVDSIDNTELNTLLVELQPAHIALQAGKGNDILRDEKRAEILRHRLKGSV